MLLWSLICGSMMCLSLGIIFSNHNFYWNAQMVLSLHGVSTLTENTCLAGFEKLLKQPCALQYTALVARWYFGKSKGNGWWWCYREWIKAHARSLSLFPILSNLCKTTSSKHHPKDDKFRSNFYMNFRTGHQHIFWNN